MENKAIFKGHSNETGSILLMEISDVKIFHPSCNYIWSDAVELVFNSLRETFPHMEIHVDYGVYLYGKFAEGHNFMSAPPLDMEKDEALVDQGAMSFEAYEAKWYPES